MNPKITVLMSVYNEEKRVLPTIKSILSQSFRNFEFWIIDDGSTDKTWQVISSVKDRRLKTFHRKKNSGMTTCLNWAVPRIKTEFVARMDSHNLANRDRLTKQIAYLLANPSVMALGSNYNRVDGKGKQLMETNFPTRYADIKRKLVEKNVFKHASMIFRTQIYAEVGLYNSYFRVAQDYDFILRVAAKHEVGNLKDCLVTEVYQSVNMTQKHRARSAWEALIAQVNALTKYSYPFWQSIFLIRGVLFLGKSISYQLIH